MSRKLAKSLKSTQNVINTDVLDVFRVFTSSI